VFIAVLLGGFYGALYDQITYAISPEFFTKMRFAQYNIEHTANVRWEVAKIGFYHTWSVGFGLGLFLALAGLLHSETKKMFYTTIQAFLITLGTGFLFSLIAYLFSSPTIDISSEINVTDKAAFNKVLNMNNYGYVGGVIGMFVGLGWQVLRTRRRLKK
jgi:hypothetical protein